MQIRQTPVIIVRSQKPQFHFEVLRMKAVKSGPK
jgi:hypothetical protein